MAAAQEDECRWVRFEMILTMRGIYINFNLNLLTKFTWSSRSTKFKNILQWNISQMITKTIPISTKIATRVIPHQMVQNSWGFNMTHLIIWQKSAKLLQHIRYDNPEKFSLISCMDQDKSLFKVSEVRLKTPKLKIQSKFIWLLELYISGSTNSRKVRGWNSSRYHIRKNKNQFLK